MSTRVGFSLRIAPDRLADYIAAHEAVWPEMLAEIAAAGRRNYSLFLAEDAVLFGYYETDDDAAAQAYLAQSEVSARWEAAMAPLFVGLEGRADQGASRLTEVFNLDDQIAQAAGSRRPAASDHTESDSA